MQIITQLPPNRVISGVYVLRFSAPLGNPDKPKGQAQHYAGWALDVHRRIAEHRRGEGAKITAAAVERGYTLEFVCVWVDATPEDEKKLKSWHSIPRWLKAHLPKPAPETDPAPQYTAREMYERAFRAQRVASRKQTTRRERKHQQQLLADLTAVNAHAVKAALTSAAAPAPPVSLLTRLAGVRAKHAAAQRMETVMVAGEKLAPGDIFRFSDDPATWITITNVSGWYTRWLDGVRADGIEIARRRDC
jgi:putative endonuclease